ncbi:DUF2381 family protein [Hyalangium versicolor]|uniref:DUF2381 family protein n=1 Tax=Hyalangium versicolor TaxID=2861190 RepID=UPI00281670C7|nr:DUF2381 family protein [Hyalangium versicolor]
MLSVRMKPEHLAPGEAGQLVIEAVMPPLARGNHFGLELTDASGQRLLSLEFTVN